MEMAQTVGGSVPRGITPTDIPPVAALMARREADVREGRAFCEKHDDWHLGECPRCEAEKPVPASPEQQLHAMLSLLARTVWDTAKSAESASQWDALIECTSDAVKLMQRLDGRPEKCDPWPNPVTGKQRTPRKARK